MVANQKHVEILRRGTKVVNEWRATNPGATLQVAYVDFHEADLCSVNLSKADLSGVNLSKADLSGANLSKADLGKADLRGANLSESDLSEADLSGADLRNANLRNADLIKADLSGADLSGADLSKADLSRADLRNAGLRDADLSLSQFAFTLLSNVDLRTVKGLESVKHAGPSILAIDTILNVQNLQGEISEVFLRGCGVPDFFIEYMRSFINQPIQYYSCFISYSTKDQDFAQRLYDDLQSAGVRCWFAPEDVHGGKKLHEQIDEAIRYYDKLLLILSPDSMASDWVKTEIAKARKRETSQKRPMLFPVRLVSFKTLQEWECFDADTGKDSAREIREYYIPDFSEWKTSHDKYKSEFEKLLRDLKTDSRKPA